VSVRPDILVLGSGGVLGEAWLTGVLAGLEDGAGVDLRDCEYFVGTSAGALVAARLASGQRPRRPALDSVGLGSGATDADAGGGHGVEPSGLQRHQPSVARTALTLAERTVVTVAEQAGAVASWGATMALSAGAPLMPAGLALATPGAALARAAALRALPRPRAEFSQLRDELAGLSAHFDGRLRVVAVARASGRRTVFGQPSSPRPDLADAVEASCAVPWLVGPVAIDGVEYVDGGVWSPTNLDVAPAKRDTHVLCLSPTAGRTGPGIRSVGATSPTTWPPGSLLRLDSRALSPVGRRLSRSVTNVEAAALRGRRAQVQLIVPDDESASAIGPELMDSARTELVLRGGYRQGLRLSGAGSVTER
jgi:NTE family protein